MSKVSAKYGEIVSSFLKRNGLTFRAAAFKSGISAAYWKDMSDGRVPSEDVVTRISGAFENLDENELRAAAGYALNQELMDPVQAIDVALRHQKSIPAKGKREILDFVKEIQQRYRK